MLDVRKVLTQPLAWEALKRVLKAGEIVIESLGQMASLISTVSLQPEPIPLDVKVVFSGDRMLYYLLSALDPEFPELFKVAADFDDDLGRDETASGAYAHLIATLARRNDIRPIDRGGVQRLIEFGSRLAGDAEKLSLGMSALCDLMSESDFYAGEEATAQVTAAHVQRAVECSDPSGQSVA